MKLRLMDTPVLKSLSRKERRVEALAAQVSYMTPEQDGIFSYTVSHFREIARQNRFAENSAIDHDSERCAVCHPELLPMEPFEVYLWVVARSIEVRRPRLDLDLVKELNSDLSLMGTAPGVTLDALAAGEPIAALRWKEWVESALATGLGLLSVHSPGSLDFDLDEARSQGFDGLIEAEVGRIMALQRKNTPEPGSIA